MFHFFLLCLLLFAPFVSLSKMPEKAQIFWEVKKSHVPTSYLLGTMHIHEVDPETGLSQEIEEALDNAQSLHIEANLNEIISGEVHDFNVSNRIFTLPSGEFLSDFIEPELVRQFFHIIQSHPKNETPGSILYYMPRILDYDFFSRLTPESLYHIINTLINHDKYSKALRQSHYWDQNANRMHSDYCGDRPYFMDDYLRSRVVCNKSKQIPIHYLESNFSDSNMDMAFFLNRHVFLDNQKMSEYFNLQAPLLLKKINNSFYPEEEEWVKNLHNILAFLIINVMKQHYYNGKNIMAYLDKQLDLRSICPVLKDTPAFYPTVIKNLEEDIIKDLVSSINYIFYQGDRSKIKILFPFPEQMQEHSFEAFSFCYGITINSEDEKIIKDAWVSRFLLAKESEVNMMNMIFYRDLIQVQGMLPFLKRGGAFVAVGYAHLQGVRKHLEEEGYTLTPIPLSHGFLQRRKRKKEEWEDYPKPGPG